MLNTRESVRICLYSSWQEVMHYMSFTEFDEYEHWALIQAALIQLLLPKHFQGICTLKIDV